MSAGFALLLVLAAPFAIPAISTVLFMRWARARRERLAAREQVGRLCDPRDQDLL